MNEPRVIYRRAPSVGNPPTMQVVQRRDGQLNTRRLRDASPLMTMRPHSRRAFGRRGVFFFLLVAALAIAFVVIASQPGTAHGQIAIDPWPQMECASGAACYFAFVPVVWR